MRSGINGVASIGVGLQFGVEVAHGGPLVLPGPALLHDGEAGRERERGRNGGEGVAPSHDGTHTHTTASSTKYLGQ